MDKTVEILTGLIKTVEDTRQSICDLCKTINPQHKNCTNCMDMEPVDAQLYDARIHLKELTHG